MSELYLPDIELRFDKFCDGCKKYDIDIVEGNKIYANGQPSEIYISPTTVVCKHMAACKRMQWYMEDKHETCQSN